VFGQDAIERPADRRNERRVRLVELDHEGIGVGRFEARDVADLARTVVGDADDVVELGGLAAA
jgi:hypothetical protein